MNKYKYDILLDRLVLFPKCINNLFLQKYTKKIESIRKLKLLFSR